MDKDEYKGIFKEGVSYKAAEVSPLEVDAAELRKINKYTIAPLTEEEVFAFRISVGSNELDDRNYEPFNLVALNDMKSLYPGKTMIKDHIHKADNQIARVYDSELVQNGKLVKETGELHTELYLKCYMVRTDSNKDLIAEIRAGIKKEVSTATIAKKKICSICGVDNRKTFCPHWWGKEYETDSGKKTCYFTIDGVKEAYEVSFVPIPAQPTAGTRKAAAVEAAEKEEKAKKEAEALALEAEFYENKFKEVYDE